MTLRERRIENEWKFLLRLQDENPAVIEGIERCRARGGDWFSLTLHRTNSLDCSAARESLTSHRVRMHFPEYFPSVPLEAFLHTPVLHPNVHPESGFVCLWDKFSAGDSIVEAVRKLQRTLTWEIYNQDVLHLMQPEAFDPQPADIPFYSDPIRVPEDLAVRAYQRAPDQFRKRLSEIAR